MIKGCSDDFKPLLQPFILERCITFLYIIQNDKKKSADW